VKGRIDKGRWWERQAIENLVDLCNWPRLRKKAARRKPTMFRFNGRESVKEP
jgi:hypothetical protein